MRLNGILSEQRVDNLKGEMFLNCTNLNAMVDVLSLLVIDEPIEVSGMLAVVALQS